MADETTAATTQSDYEYKLGYSGEEVDSVCEKVMSLNTAESINQATKKALALKEAATINSAVTKVSKVIFGKAEVKEGSSSLGKYYADATVNLSAYSNPVCIATLRTTTSLSMMYGITVNIGTNNVRFNLQTNGAYTLENANYIYYVIGEAT